MKFFLPLITTLTLISKVTIASEATPSLQFALVGDVFIGEPERMRLSPEIQKTLSEADFVFGNLEGPICKQETQRRPCRGKQETCYYYKMPPQAATLLSDLGFSALSLANNHIYDFGHACAEETRSTLTLAGIGSTGAKGSQQLFEKDGIHVAFLAFHTSPWANDIYDLRSSMELIRKAKQAAEIVVVSVHAGAEGEGKVWTPGVEETDFGERRGNIFLFAHRAVDAGADLVFGHGPHVLRPLENYRGKLIAYSLGNFATFPGFNLLGNLKRGTILTVQLNLSGNWTSAHLMYTLQDSNGSLSLDPEPHNLNTLIESPKTFPLQNQIRISAQGQILKGN